MPVQSPVAPPPVTPQIISQPQSQPMAFHDSSPRKTIFDYIPLGLVMRLAKPYLAGQSKTDAIEMAHQLQDQSHYASTLDILGEDSTSDQDCQSIVKDYQDLIDAVKSRPLNVLTDRQQISVSMKPSMFSTTAPRPGKQSEAALELAFDRISKVVDYAFRNNIKMTLEAEDHRWTNFQLEAYFALISAGYTNLGTVLQTRLLRTEKDLKRFDNRMRVRLVIGIYNEPKEIAHTDKKVMKDLLVGYAGELIDKGTYSELATHDASCVESFYRRIAIPRAVSATAFEHQFLLGVPRAGLQKGLVDGSYFDTLMEDTPDHQKSAAETLKRSGALVRMYLPYGTDKVSGAYCRRRLRENPNMIAYGIKNLLGIQ